MCPQPVFAVSHHAIGKQGRQSSRRRVVVRVQDIEFENRFDFVSHCETSSQNAGKQVRPTQIQLHGGVPEIVQPRAAGVRGLTSIQQIETASINRKMFRENLGVLHARQRCVILTTPRKCHGKVRQGYSAVDLVAVLPEMCLAAKIEMSALPQPRLLGVNIGQVVAVDTVPESLLQPACRHTLIILGRVAEKRQTIVRKYVARVTAVAGQVGSRPKIVDP